MINFDGLKKGFYKVNNDGDWTVMHFDGADWADFISGDYSACDNNQYILEVGEKIELPSGDVKGDE
jgi:hypothetical protein